MIEVTSALFVLPCFNTDPKCKSVCFCNTVHFEKLEFKYLEGKRKIPYICMDLDLLRICKVDTKYQVTNHEALLIENSKL